MLHNHNKDYLHSHLDSSHHHQSHKQLGCCLFQFHHHRSSHHQSKLDYHLLQHMGQLDPRMDQDMLLHQCYMRVHHKLQLTEEPLGFVHMCQHIQHTQLPKLYRCNNHNLLNWLNNLTTLHRNLPRRIHHELHRMYLDFHLHH